MPGKATINGTMMLIRPHQNFFSKFIYFYLQGSDFQKIVKEKISGSSVPHIFQRDMVTLNIPYPPKLEQKKIAQILTSVDEVIEATETQINKLKDLKKGMMNELLTKGIGHTEFKDSAVGWIPVGWEIKPLKTFCDKICVGFVGTCEPFYRESGIPMIRTGNLKNGRLDLSILKYVSEEFHHKQKKSQLIPGDLLIARHGEHGKASIVPSCLLESNCLNVIIVRINKQYFIPLFLKYLFNSDVMARAFESKAEGSTQKVISTTEVAKSFFPKPPLPEQQKIASILSSIDNNIEQKQNKLTQTKNLKKSLMADLLTGRVRVKP